MRDFAEANKGAVRLAAVCDVDNEKAIRARGKFHFEKAYTSNESMLEQERVDCAVVVTRPLDMRVALEPFFRRRIPVLTEKPLGDNIEQARDIVKSAGKYDAPAMVSFNRRFDPAIKKALRWMSDKGAPSSIHGVMRRHKRTERDFVWGTGIHIIDLLWSLAGPMNIESMKEVRGGGCSRVAHLSGKDGIPILLEIFPVCGNVEEKVSISGEGWYGAVWTGSAHPWRARCMFKGACEIDYAAPDDQPEYIRNGSSAETVAFLEAALEGRNLPAPSLEESLSIAELAWAIQSISHLHP